MEERIDQRGLAVVDVRDDGDVPPGRIGYRHLTSIPASGLYGLKQYWYAVALYGADIDRR
jgi:hypothetical protein